MRRNAVILLIMIAGGVYATTLLNGFVAGDRQFILRNASLQSPGAFIQSLTSDYWGALGAQSFVYYRPLTILTHLADVRLYGLSPAGHHMSNIFMHVLVTLLVYRLFCFLLPSRHSAALLGAALFALHPVHTHSVSYVMGRTDLLAALFFLAGLLSLLTGPPHTTARHTLAACLFYLLALLCKEMAATLPAVYVLFYFCRHKRIRGWALWTPVIALGITLGLYLALRLAAVGGTSPGGTYLQWYGLGQRAALICMTLGFYLWKLVLPVGLCYYSNLVIPGSITEALGSGYVLSGAAMGLMTAWNILRNPRAGFALGWICLTLLPVLNIIELPVLAKENYLYIPSVGFCLLGAQLFAALQERLRARGACMAVFAALVLFYAAATTRRNADYRGPERFLLSTLSAMKPIAPHQREDRRSFEGVKNFYTTYRNLGRIYQERNEPAKAASAFQAALAYDPSYFAPQYAADIYEGLGWASDRLGKPKEAYAFLQKALPGSRRPFFVHNSLGVLAARMQQTDTALYHFRQALRAKQDYAPARHNLGLLYQKLNMPLEAEREPGDGTTCEK